MRTRGWWLALVGMMAALCMVTSVSAAVTTYTDPQGRFSITVPDGYQRSSELGPNILAFNSPIFVGANFNVIAATVPTGTTLIPLIPTRAQFEDLFRAVLSDQATFDFLPGGFGAATIAGHPAVQDDSILTTNGERIRLRQFLILDGTTEYAISFGARETEFDAFVKESHIVLDSFTILRGSPSTFIHRLGDG
ncbi:MAG: hypothetical protein M3Y58_17650 [Chloroflexota bacterium]|nr:hypothetical protein [Chloroflexota bacterium]